MRLTQLDTDIPENVERFLSLIGARREPLSGSHFLSPLIDQYDVWSPSPDYGQLPVPVLQLGSIASNVLLFKNDWQHPAAKAWMVNRIRHPDQSKGILFEFRAATHYLFKHRNTRWMPNCNGRSELDIRIETSTGEVVYAECTRKQESKRRFSESNRLIHDVLLTLHKKAKQRSSFPRPLHLVIHVPEEHDWRDDSLNRELGRRLHGRFARGIYNAISGLTVISTELPSVRRNNEGQLFWDSSLPALTYLNRWATYPFPEGFGYHITISG